MSKPAPWKTVRALRHRNFRLFFWGQLISLSGTWMQSVAQAWLVYRLTHSAFWLGMAAFAGQIPVLLFGLWGGDTADRFRKHRLLLLTQFLALMQALFLGALTLSGHIQVWHILLLAFLLGTINAFDVPIRQSFFVDMVGTEDLPNAIALNSSAVNVARLIGPTIAGFIIATAGEGICFLVNSVSYVAALAALYAMRIPPEVPAPKNISPIENIREGIAYAAGHPRVRVLLTLLALVSVTGMSYVTLMPIFAAEILQGGPKTLGMLMGSMGMGALGGALTLARRSGVDGLDRSAARAAILLGAALVLFSASRIYALSLCVLPFVGFGMVWQMAATNTVLQSIVPNGLRGRVMSLYIVVFMGLNPFGNLAAGSVAHLIGAPWTLALAGAITVAGGVIAASRLENATHSAPA